MFWGFFPVYSFFLKNSKGYGSNNCKARNAVSQLSRAKTLCVGGANLFDLLQHCSSFVTV